MVIGLLTLLTLVVIGNVAGLTEMSTGDGIVYRLDIEEDVWLEGNSNHNNLNLLIVGKHTSYEKKRSLLRFESLPASCSSVEFAKVYMYFDHAFKGSFSNSVAPYFCRFLRVHQVTNGWSESVATTTKRLNGVCGNNNWAVPSVGIGMDTFSTILDTVDVCPFRPQGYIQFDVTQAATNWAVSSQTNYGILLYDTKEEIDGRDLRFLGKGTNKPPFLDVKCN